MSKGQTQTTSFKVPDWESQSWQNLVSQAGNQTQSDINSVNYGQLNSQFQNGSQDILNQRVDPNSLQSGIVGAGQKSWTDPGTAASYMSPYTNTALASQVNLDRSQLLDPQLAGIDRQAAGSGALGGSRNAISRQMANNSFNTNESNVIAQGENNAYNTGIAAFNSDANRNLQGQTAGAQTNLAGANSNVYADFASGQNALNGIAASEAPGQQYGQLAGIMGQLPNQGTQQTQTSQTAGSSLGGILGGLLGGAGQLITGLKAPGKANGGLIKKKMAKGGIVGPRRKMALVYN